MAIRLVASDIDGTLVDDQGQVSERTRRVLAEASACGVVLAIASGRTVGSMSDVLPYLPPMDYLIQSNGASVLELKTGRVLFSRPFPSALLAPVIACLGQAGVAWHAFIGGKACIDAPFAPIYREHLGSVRAEKFRPIEGLAEKLLTDPPEIEKLGVITPDRALRERLMEQLSAYSELRISSACWFNIEINDRMATKGNALLALLDHLHISPQEAAAFGDAPNDLTMLEAVGYGVAMGNAAPEVLQRAAYQTVTNGEDGVARFLAQQLGLSC